MTKDFSGSTVYPDDQGLIGIGLLRRQYCDREWEHWYEGGHEDYDC